MTSVSLPNDAMQKAVTDAFFTLVDRARSNEHNAKKVMEAPPTSANKPMSWFTDPWTLLDSVGMGYRHSPTTLTYETLRQVSEKNDVIAAIMLTRVNQVAAFCRPQKNKYSVGFKITTRGPEKRTQMTDSETRRIQELTNLLLHTGIDYNLGRDSFETWVRKVVRDSLTYDQLCTEKVPTKTNGIHSFFAVPADTIRIAQPKIGKGTPADKAALKRELKYVQVMQNNIQTEYTIEEMIFGVRNPRTHVKVYGYGFPEIEQLITTVTAHLYAEEWNRRQFSQGSTVKGVLNLQGNMPLNQFEMFKRQWQAQVSGISNAWRTPVTNQEGIQWIPLQLSNTEMGYQMWMEYLIKIISAIFQIDPAEINFDLRGGSQQQPLFMSSNEAQQKVSKDRGLHPLLRFLEDLINKHIIWRVDPRFEFEFAGLDAKTEEQAMQLRTQQAQTVFTLNEIRAMEDRPPLPHGDIVMNPTYTGFLSQKEAMAAQSQMMQQGAPGGPGASGPPGAPPAGGQQPGPQAQPGGGMDAQQPEQMAPYMNKFQGKPAGDEEKAAANNMHQFIQRDEETSSPNDPPHDSSTPEDEGDGVSDLDSLHINDWDSTVHASVKDNDLNKSVQLFDTFEV